VATLEASITNVRGSLWIMEHQPGQSPVLQGLQGKLILWVELASGTLKELTRC
jgi:hypothetical protein